MIKRFNQLAVLTLLLAFAIPRCALAQQEGNPTVPTPAPAAPQDQNQGQPGANTNHHGTAQGESNPTNHGAHSPPSNSGATPHKPKNKPQAPALAPPSKESAQQIADSFKAAVQTAKNLGVAAPDSWGQGPDGFNAKAAELKANLDAAKNQQDVDKVVAQYAAALSEILPRMTRENSGSDASKRSEPAAGSTAAPETDASFPGRLALYVALGTLLLSLLTSLGGWILARREINRVLIDAGLM